MHQSLRIPVIFTVLIASGLLVGIGGALAQNAPFAQNCTATLATQGLQPLSMFLVPNGSGTPLSGCYDSAGMTVNAMIVVNLRDVMGAPAVNVPVTDVRLEYLNSQLVWCGNNWYPPPAYAPNLADVAIMSANYRATCP